MVKRVLVPIELHFGDKYYYLNVMWENFNYLVIPMVIGYLLLAHDMLRKLWKKKLAITESRDWYYYLVLSAALPFFVFLNIGKSKLYWYMTFLLPFFCLIFSYLYLKIPNRIIRVVLILVLIYPFITTFYNRTYAFKTTYVPTERLDAAACISKQQGNTVAVLVGEEERKIKNFLEAAQYQTNSSFLYGGSPSFVYYSNKKIQYYYDVDIFMKEYTKYPLYTMLPADYEAHKDVFIDKEVCSNPGWKTFKR
jgi:hypothetical protein